MLMQYNKQHFLRSGLFEQQEKFKKKFNNIYFNDNDDDFYIY